MDAQGDSSVARATTLISAVRPPSVLRKAIKRVTATSALLRALVYPNGASTTAYFEYGTTKTFDAQTAPQNAGTAIPKTIGRSVTGLLASTTYYYRAVATSTAGTTFGKTFSFTTSS